MRHSDYCHAHQPPPAPPAGREPPPQTYDLERELQIVRALNDRLATSAMIADNSHLVALAKTLLQGIDRAIKLLQARQKLEDTTTSPGGLDDILDELNILADWKEPL